MLTRSPEQKVTILDPCCGKGAAVQQLAAGLSIPEDDTYCIELDEARGRATQEAMPKANVLTPASFLGTSIKTRAFSLCYLNPPFDDAGGGIRVELQFLQRATPLLADGGILAMVCPEDVAEMGMVQRFMKMWFDSVKIIPFDAAYRKYREVFVMGIKRADIWPESWREDESWIEENRISWRLPQSKGPGLHFEKNQLTPLELDAALNKSPLRKFLASLPKPPLPSPPLSLGAGHIALLLSSGHLDGLVLEPGGGRHVVRGTAKKVEEETDKSTDKVGSKKISKRTVTERIKLTVRVIDHAGTIKTLE